MNEALALVSVSRTFTGPDGPLTVLDDVSVTVNTGERVAVVGPSGSGKSTLLGLVAGLDRPTRGSVRVAGTDLAHLAPGALAEFRGRQIGFIFQSFRLLPTLTALENVRVPLDLAGRADADTHARSWLEQVGLGARLHHLPTRLSGGEQQRVALARAFSIRPRILFADEPTGNLDSTTSEEILTLFEKLHDEGQTIVLVTHEHDIAAHARRQIHLKDGRVEQDFQTERDG